MLKIKNLIGVTLTALFLLSITTIAVSAAPLFDRDGPLDAKLQLFCPNGSDSWDVHATQIGDTVVLMDMSQGKRLWKKWYVDGNLIDTSTANSIRHTFNDLGYHTVTLKVANHGGSDTDKQTIFISPEHVGPWIWLQEYNYTSA